MDDVKSAVSESLSETTKSIDERFAAVEGKLPKPEPEKDPDWEMPEGFADMEREEQKRILDQALNTRVGAIEKKLSAAVESNSRATMEVYARQLVPSIQSKAMDGIPDDLKPAAEKYLNQRLTEAAKNNPQAFQNVPDSEIETIAYQALGYAMKNKGSIPQDATPAGANQAAQTNAVDEKIKDYWQSKHGTRDIPQADLERIRKGYK